MGVVVPMLLCWTSAAHLTHGEERAVSGSHAAGRPSGRLLRWPFTSPSPLEIGGASSWWGAVFHEGARGTDMWPPLCTQTVRPVGRARGAPPLHPPASCVAWLYYCVSHLGPGRGPTRGALVSNRGETTSSASTVGYASGSACGSWLGTCAACAVGAARAASYSSMLSRIAATSAGSAAGRVAKEGGCLRRRRARDPRPLPCLAAAMMARASSWLPPAKAQARASGSSTRCPCAELVDPRIPGI